MAIGWLLPVIIKCTQHIDSYVALTLVRCIPGFKTLRGKLELNFAHLIFIHGVQRCIFKWRQYMYIWITSQWITCMYMNYANNPYVRACNKRPKCSYTISYQLSVKTDHVTGLWLLGCIVAKRGPSWCETVPVKCRPNTKCYGKWLVSTLCWPTCTISKHDTVEPRLLEWHTSNFVASSSIT